MPVSGGRAASFRGGDVELLQQRPAPPLCDFLMPSSRPIRNFFASSCLAANRSQVNRPACSCRIRSELRLKGDDRRQMGVAALSQGLKQRIHPDGDDS